MSQKLTVNDVVALSLKDIVLMVLENKDCPVEQLIDKAFYRFVDDVGGLQIYIARHTAIPHRNKLIRQEFNGNNIIELSRKYNLSFVHIYSILSKKEKENENSDI